MARAFRSELQTSELLLFWENSHLACNLKVFYPDCQITTETLQLQASLVPHMVKNLPAMQETGSDPWVEKIPWRKEWLPTPAFLPGESHGQRSLVGYTPCDLKESDTTEWVTLSLFIATSKKYMKHSHMHSFGELVPPNYSTATIFAGVSVVW